MIGSIDYLFRFLRIRDWYVMLGIPLIAMKDDLLVPDNLIVLLISALYLACGYSFNNVFDIGNDGKEKNIIHQLWYMELT